MLTVQDVVDLFLDGLDPKTKLICRAEGHITFEPGYLEVTTVYKEHGGPEPKDLSTFAISTHGKPDREDYLVIGRDLG